MAIGSILTHTATPTKSVSIPAPLPLPTKVKELPAWITSDPFADPWATKPVPLPMVDVIVGAELVQVADPEPFRYHRPNRLPLEQYPLKPQSQNLLTGSCERRLQVILENDSDISDTAQSVLFLLAYHVFNPDHPGQCWPSISLLVKESKKSRSSVQRGIKELSKSGWVRVTPNIGATNTYTIFDRPVNDSCHEAVTPLEAPVPDLREQAETVRIPDANDGIPAWVKANWHKLEAMGWHYPGGAIKKFRRDPAEFAKARARIENPEPPPEQESEALPDVDLSNCPDWYVEFVESVQPGSAPAYQTIEEMAILTGWSEAVLSKAAGIFVKGYGDKQVSNPSALFKTLATSAAKGIASKTGTADAYTDLSRKESQRSKFESDFLRQKQSKAICKSLPQNP